MDDIKSKKPLNKGWCDIGSERLVAADWNYKEDDEIKIAKLTENLKRNGQVENILVRELETGFYEVVNGNHRLKAFPDANIKSIHVFNLGKISDSAAMRIAVETNETRFESNSIKLAEVMKEIGSEFSVEELAKTMPYTVDDIAKMQELLDFDWNQFNKDPESSQDSSEKVIKVSVTPDKYEEVKGVLSSVLAPFDSFVKIR